METVVTKYGSISNCLNVEMHQSNQPASLMFTQYQEINTKVGIVVPQYEVEDYGRQQHRPVYFYETGNIRKLPLQDKKTVRTKHGIFSAELLMFYEDGSLKKLFPLNGKLSGYWNEKNEYAFAGEQKISLPSGDISAKIINLGFYPSGNIRSITLWPEEQIEAQCPVGTIKVRKGIAFYENGSVRSLEPAALEAVKTPIGTIKAFDNDPEGICGDVNSLQFDNQGNISSLCTISNRIIVTSDSQLINTYEPSKKPSLCSDLVKISIPLQMEFLAGKIRFNHNPHHEYEIPKYSFRIESYADKIQAPVYEC